LPLPERPKTSFNVGVVEGGLSVNTIAPAASFVLDLRSVDALELRRLATAVEDRAQAAAGGELTVEVDLLGERPAGELPADSRIVRTVSDVLATLGIAAVLDASSTDANIPLSRGVPAVCIGLTTGGNVHREDEYIDLAPVATGLAQLALTTLRVADELRHGTLPTLAVSASSSR
jgi:acetylornithine deacetylase/succinyl-diaminopimelate desuccinylase-like protein